MAVHFECLDYQGVRITCEAEVWFRHILRARPHMEGHEPDMQRAIAEPLQVYADRSHGSRKAFYGVLIEQSPPRLLYLKVVIRYGEVGGQAHGWVVTAYARRTVQEGGTPLWTR